MKLPAQGRTDYNGFSAGHQAVDIGGNNGQWFGTPIVAPHDGTVTAAGQMGSGTNNAGLAIDIDGGRFKSRLAHNDKILVSVGQQVKKGQQVGTQGYTGYTIPAGKGGTHCHWVLWDNGTRVDGLKYIKEDNVLVDLPALTVLYRFYLGTEVSQYGLDNRLGKQTFQEAADGLKNSDQYKELVKQAKEGKLPVKNLPLDIRNKFGH